MTTEDNIIQAALRQVEVDGYENLSLRKIATEVGMTTGAFYRNFNNKDELFTRLTILLSDQASKEFETENVEICSAKGALLQLALFLLNKFQVEPHLMDFLFFNPVSVKMLKNPQNNFQLFTVTMKYIDQLQEEYRSLNTQEFFVQIWSFIQGYAMLIKNGITPVNEQLIDKTLDAFLEVD